MAFGQIHFFSPALGKAVSAAVILPEMSDHPGPFPVFYLLHGLSDDHTIWMRRTSLERHVNSLPLMVVMPDGGRSFYCDAVEGPAHEKSLMQDVIGYVDRTFRTIPAREGRVIGGLSMGGYGALKLALKYPDRFCSVVSHSGALGIAHEPFPPDLEPELTRLFGSHPQGGPEDVFALAARLDPAQRPAIRFDCGKEDFLLQQNRDFHEHLVRLGIPHEYEEFPGGHSWDYWDLHVQEAIAFHARALGLH